MVPDLLWDDVRWFFDPKVMGPMPDVCIPGASLEDWQSVLDLVVAQEWAFQYSEGAAVLPLPAAAGVFSRPAGAECPELRVWPSVDVLAIFRFYAANEIDFDVDLRELQGQERLEVFCGFLAAIGRFLGKAVLMDSEGGDGSHPVLGFDVEADRVVVMAEPHVAASAGLLAADGGAGGSVDEGEACVGCEVGGGGEAAAAVIGVDEDPGSGPDADPRRRR